MYVLSFSPYFLKQPTQKEKKNQRQNNKNEVQYGNVIFTPPKQGAHQGRFQIESIRKKIFLERGF